MTDTSKATGVSSLPQHQHQQRQQHGGSRQAAVLTDMIYGCINSIMVIPISISFCTIIFRDEAFVDYMPFLVKLVLFSSAIHQICFALFSSLPFAIGQVQDAGLIFLSAMAADIARRLSNQEPSIVPTTLYTLGICTALLGAMLMVVAKMKLASMVQYLPMPVVGGYLAFIGFFCGLAGLSLMAGVQVTSIIDFSLFFNVKSLILLAPGVAVGVTTYFLLGYFRSPFVLPASLLFILAAFYATMFISGTSFQEARDYGWIAPLIEVGSPFEAWSYYDYTKVEWHVFPHQLITLFAMFLVVAFSSSLDVAAIEMELGAPLDYNKELNTVGISNLVSGLCGGYTGSYIFSQTIFSMRRGVSSTICGFIVAAGELVFVLLPISITSYVPKMFFGSLLVLIATDLMVEWLLAARAKMMLSEYLVCLFTFAAIQCTGIEVGMFLGILAATLSFVVTYSKLQSVSEVTLKSSTVIRTFEERSLLIASRGKIVTISFGGYIFFGSSVRVLEQIKSKLVLSPSEPQAPLSLSPSLDNSIHSVDPTVKTASSKSVAVFVPSAKAHHPAQTPYCELNAQNKTNYAIQMKTPKSSKKKLPSPAKQTTPNSSSSSRKKERTSSRSDDDDIEAGMNERSSLLPHHRNRKAGGERANGYGAVGGREAAHSDHEENVSSSPTLKLVYVPASPKHKRTIRDVSSSPSQNTSSFLSTSLTSQSHSYHHHPAEHMKTVYELTPSQLQRQFQNWQEEEVKHEKEMQNKSNAATSSAVSLPLSMSETNQVKTVDDNWLVGEDLELSQHPQSGGGGGGIEVLSEGIRRPSLLSSALESSHLVSNETTTTAKSTLTPSASLLDLVWKNQAVKREKKLRSMSDLSDDTIYNSTGITTATGFGKGSPARKTRTNSFGISPGLPPIPFTPASPQANLNHLSPEKPKQQEFPGRPIAPTAVPLLPKLNHQVQETSTSTEEVVTEYLVLDFSEVKGLDATAARSCFLTLVHLMRNANVKIVFASLSKELEELLRSHRVLDNDSLLIPDIDDALEWCEDQIIHTVAVQRQVNAKERHQSSKQVRDYINASKQRQLQSQLKTPRASSSSSSQQVVRLNSTSSDNNSLEDIPATVDRTRAQSQPSSSSAALLGPLKIQNPLEFSLPIRSLRTIIEDYLEIDTSLFPLSPTTNGAAAAIAATSSSIDASLQQISSLLDEAVLRQYFQQEHFDPYHLIYDIEDMAEKVYFIENGNVELVTMSPMQLEQSKWLQQQAAEHTPASVKGTITNGGNNTLAIAGSSSQNSGSRSSYPLVKRVNKVCAGGIFGESDFFLARNHSLRAYTTTECVCWTLTREQFSAMEMNHPQLCMLVQYTMLKSLAIAANCAMYALHPTAANTAAEV